jgi:5-methylcytosine-specific restriction endonuclease McrA
LETIKLEQLNLLDVGNKIQLAGIIMSDGHTDYYCYLPENNKMPQTELLEMGTSDWEKFIQQTDNLETEILAKDKTGKLVKVLLRKSTRQIEAGVSWKVFARDNYHCRYCGVTGVPLTVDHLVCWEVGGPSIEANLVTSCRKCNKLRGNMVYSEWLRSKDYLERSKGLSDKERQNNMVVALTLKDVPLKHHITSR